MLSIEQLLKLNQPLEAPLQFADGFPLVLERPRVIRWVAAQGDRLTGSNAEARRIHGGMHYISTMHQLLSALVGIILIGAVPATAQQQPDAAGQAKIDDTVAAY